MVIEPFDRMGPLPRSHAAEANDCFMVRPQHGPTGYKGAAQIFAHNGGLPSVRADGSITDVVPLFGSRVRDRGVDLPLPFGIGVTYTYVAQDTEVSHVKVKNRTLDGLNIPAAKTASRSSASALSQSSSLPNLLSGRRASFTEYPAKPRSL